MCETGQSNKPLEYLEAVNMCETGQSTVNMCE